MFKTICIYHELNEYGRICNEPHVYTIDSKNEPTDKELDDLFWQMVEIECIADGQLIYIEQMTNKDDGYQDYRQAIVKVSVTRTEKPSQFIFLRDMDHNIFKIDRNSSSYSIESRC